MFNRFYSAVFDLCRGKRAMLLVISGLMLVASIIGVVAAEFDSNMEIMLPTDQTLQRNLKFLRSADISGKVVISLELTGDDVGKAGLINAIDHLSGSLDKELFPHVLTGISTRSGGADMESIGALLPEIAGPEDLKRIDAMLTNEHVRARLRESYRQMLGPGGLFMHSQVRRDPLMVQGIAFKRLQSITSAVGFDVEIVEGHFLSKDGRNAMLIASTSIPMTDSTGSRRLVESLTKTLGALPPYIKPTVISGHVHTVSNEDMVQRDIMITASITTIVFLIFFIGVIADISAFLLFFIPLFAVVISVGLTYLILGKLSYTVIGIGTVVAGITDNYGIHVYLATRRGGPDGQSVKEIALPTVVSGLATMSIFFSFFFSGVKGYHQMAVFTILSVLMALVLALVFLPHLLPAGWGRRGALQGASVRWLEETRLSSGPVVAVAFIATAFMLAMCFFVKFDSDITALDGTEKGIIKSEERFGEVWGRKRLAILVTEDADRERLFRSNEELYLEASKALGDGHIASISAIWPSEATRRENLARWEAFWADGREDRLRSILAKEGKGLGFSEQAFDPFFANLRGRAITPETPDLGFNERFIQKYDGNYRMMSYFEDTREAARQVNSIVEQRKDAYVISGVTFSDKVSTLMMRDLWVMGFVAVSLVIAITAWYCGNLWDTVAALTPVVFGLIWMNGVLPLLGLSINVANMIATIVVIGLCMDYGVFMVHRTRSHEKEDGTITSVTVGAVTTILGTAALLLARHPALYSIGVTLTVGVSVGYFTAILVVPWLSELGARRRAVRGAS